MKFKHPSATAENSHEGPQHRDILAILNEADVHCSVLDDSPPEAPSVPIVVNGESLGTSKGVVRSANPTQLNSKRKPLIFWIL